MVARIALLLPMVAACGGPTQETLIAELRVVAAVADPPAVEPGEAYTLTITVADPLGEGSEVLLWSCLPDLPEEGYDAACFSTVEVPVDEVVSLDALAVAPVPIWVLACAPGLCGDLRETPEERLLDPFDWLAGLPVSGVSAALRSTPLLFDGVEPAVNPVIERAPEAPLQATVGEEVALGFSAPGAHTAFGYATAGGFMFASFDVSSEGDTELRWFAPEEPGQVRLYVVFEDGLGGSVVWRADVEVR